MRHRRENGPGGPDSVRRPAGRRLSQSGPAAGQRGDARTRSSETGQERHADVNHWWLGDAHCDERLAFGGPAPRLGGPDMTSKFTELAIDCADPNGLARFWCSVLDYEVQDEDDGIVTIGSPMVPEGKNHLGPVPPTLTFHSRTCLRARPSRTGSTSTSTQPTGSRTKRSVACST